MAEQKHWWEEPFRTFQTNLREIDAGLDVPKILHHIVDLGANTWLLNTAGIVSFYPSELPFAHPSPWLSERASGDLVGDVLEAAHREGVRVISRVDFSKVHADIAAEHPDWCFVDTTGGRQLYNGLHSTCPSAPYYQERSFEIIAEVLDRYPIDGFFFNWFNFNQRDYSGRRYGICQCGHCHVRFAERYGAPLPTAEDWDDPAYLSWLRYTEETLDDVAGRIRTAIKDRSPETALILRRNTDVMFQEVNNAVDRPQPLWTYWAGESVRESRAVDPERPILVNSVMFVDLPYRFVAEQPGLLQLHLTQTMAHGGNPSAYMVGTPEIFSGQPIFDAIGDVLRFHRDNEGYYRDHRSTAQVLVVSSRHSAEVYGGGTDKVRKELQGVYRALVEEHIPFDILPDSELTATALSRYDTVILPNVAVLSAAQLSLLDSYVHGGGGLIATYDTAGFDPDGAPRSDIGLKALGVARIAGRSEEPGAMRSAYLRLTDADRLAGLGETALLMLDRAFLEVEPAPGARGSLTLIPPSRYGPPEKCYWDKESSLPGLVRNEYGAGRAAYLPWPVGALFHDLNMLEYRALLAGLVDNVSGRERQVVTNAPPHVEIALATSDGRTLIHLINYSGHNGRAFGPPLQIHDIRLSLPDIGGASEVLATRLGRALPLTREDGRLIIDVPSLQLFELLVIDERRVHE
jgi:hypothetical protein